MHPTNCLDLLGSKVGTLEEGGVEMAMTLVAATAAGEAAAADSMATAAAVVEAVVAGVEEEAVWTGRSRSAREG